MALKECLECKREISSTASVCPHCGFKGVISSWGPTTDLTEMARLNAEYEAKNEAYRREHPDGWWPEAWLERNGPWFYWLLIVVITCVITAQCGDE
jgi:hypothetical protein